MKRIKYQILLIMTLIILSAIPTYASSIKLNKKTATVTVGSSITLTASVSGKSKTITWSSSNKAIATVVNGKVTGKKAGTATITAKANGQTATCKITVKAKLTKKAKVLRLYKKYLENMSDYFGDPKIRFSIKDVVGDSVPELIFGSPSDIQGDVIEVWLLYYNGKSFDRINANTAIYINKKRNTIVEDSIYTAEQHKKMPDRFSINNYYSLSTMKLKSSWLYCRPRDYKNYDITKRSKGVETRITNSIFIQDYKSAIKNSIKLTADNLKFRMTKNNINKILGA